MTDTTMISRSAPLLTTLRDAGHRAGAAIMRYSEAYARHHARTRQIERLNALSDAELARVGLSRDRIVAHVFRDVIGWQ